MTLHRTLALALLALALSAGAGRARAAAFMTPVPLGSGILAPKNLALDAAGNVFVADSASTAVREIIASGGGVTVRNLASAAGTQQLFAVDGQGDIISPTNDFKHIQLVAAQVGDVTARSFGSGLDFATSVALNAAGDVFVADPGAKTIWKIPAAGGYTQTIALASGDYAPYYIGLDAAGDIIFYDDTSGLIQELTAASGYAAPKTLAGPNRQIYGLAVDAAGDVFFADQSDQTVKELTAASGYASTATLGSGFTEIESLAVDAAGNLFVANGSPFSAIEPGNQIFELTAASAYAQQTQLGGSFNLVRGLAIDGNGTLYISSDGAMQAIPAAGGYDQPQLVYACLYEPTAVALDGAGNLFVADLDGQVVELPAASGYSQVKLLVSGLLEPTSLAFDGAGNLFVGDNTVYELPAADGYATKIAVASAPGARGLTVDPAGNIYFTQLGNYGQPSALQEIPAAGGYSSTVTLSSNFAEPAGLAFDNASNLYVVESGISGYTPSGIYELTKASGYATASLVATGFSQPNALTVDGAGDLFVTDGGSSIAPSTAATIYEVPAAPPALLAAVLPVSRSVQLGTTATIFATLINSGPAPLVDCAIQLPADAQPGLTLGYQTTDPATNQPTGTPNTPVTIKGQGGAQSFLLSFQGSTAFSAEQPLSFGCDDAVPAASTTGIDTVYLTVAATPVPDIVALSATQSGNGIVDLPLGGRAAFAVATANLGIAAPITVSVDSGGADLPVQILLCATDPATAQCLAPPAATAALDIVAGATPTFSIFVAQSLGIAIPFDPAQARLFVRFADASGNLRGATSVAIRTE